MHLAAGRAAVAVVVQPVGIGLVDDAVVGVVGVTAGALPEQAGGESAGVADPRDGVVERDRVVAHAEGDDGVYVGRAGPGVEDEGVPTGAADQFVLAGASAQQVVAIVAAEN